MNPSETLVLTIIAIYLWECWKAIPTGAVAVTSSKGGARRLISLHVLANRHGALALAPVFWPHRCVFVTGVSSAEGTPPGPSTIRRKARHLEMVSSTLRASTMLLGILIFFLFIPATLFVGIAETAWFTLPPVAAAHLLTLIAFWRAHARVYPDRHGDRVLTLVEKLLLPPANVRSLDKLSVPLFKNLSPAAVLAALVPNSLPSYVRELYRAHGGTEAWACMERPLRDLGFDVGVLFAPPLRESGDMISWCPVCLSQFAASGQKCPDCGRGDLRQFPDGK